MQTILGAGGAIGQALARELRPYSSRIRLVSRHPEKTDPDNECFPADLTDRDAVRHAVAGSEVAYLTAGLPYDHRVWASTWPVIMDNVIASCTETGARLVFFDNVYMYDPAALDPMTEDTPIAPTSRKGKIRAAIAKALLEAHRAGKLEALIARSADFYGPGVQDVSILAQTVFKPLSQGTKANWLGRDDKKHSFTYVPDAARATALLGNSPEAFGQVWHLPTAPDPLTGQEWVEHIAAAMGAKPRYRVAGKGLVRLLGVFMPIMLETLEMLYQFDRDYVFDSSKFEEVFKMTPTPYSEGIRSVVEAGFN